MAIQVFIGLAPLDAPGIGDDVARLAWFLVVALPFLLLGTWLSPGERRRELGRTLLIGTGAALFAFLTVIFPPGLPGGPGLAPYAADLSWAAGIPKLLLIGGTGSLLLYRNGAGRRRSVAGDILRRGMGPVSLYVQASLGAWRRK